MMMFGQSMLMGLALLALAPSVFAAPQCRLELIQQHLAKPDGEQVLVVAHRGAHQHQPENSLASIEAAIALGAAVVEVDIRRTRDGVYVLMHDTTLERTTNGTGPVHEVSYAELNQLQLKMSSGTLTEQRAPTLAEALAVARGQIFLMLDAKVDTAADQQAIAALVKQAQMQEQVVLYDFDPELLAQAAASLPDALRMVRSKDEHKIQALITHYQPDIFHIEPSFNRRDLNQALAQQGIPTWLNFINANAVDHAIANGDLSLLTQHIAAAPTLVQTDLPEQVITYLSQQGLHPSGLSDGGIPACND